MYDVPMGVCGGLLMMSQLPMLEHLGLPWVISSLESCRCLNAGGEGW